MSLKITYNEEQLIAGLRLQKKESFEELYDRFNGPVYGVIFNILKSDELAQDVLQESFVKIWRNFSKYDAKKGSLFTWILNVARNKAIDKYRSLSRKPEFSGLSSAIEEKPSVENLERSVENKIDVRYGLEKLKEEHQEVLNVVYFRGCSHQEAADELNLPLGTVKTRVRSALIELRKIFSEIGN